MDEHRAGLMKDEGQDLKNTFREMDPLRLPLNLVVINKYNL